MDLNELLYRQQIAQIHAARALTLPSRQRYLDRIDCYAARIRRLRGELGATTGFAVPGVPL